MARMKEIDRELDGVLRGVSRSFYLTLRLAPRAVRSQLGLSYLFCRAADTIADTALLPAVRRGELLSLFRAQFLEKEGREPAPDPAAARTIADAIGSVQGVHGASPDERRLLERLDRCFALFLGFEKDDRALVRRLVSTLTLGMKIDLESFPSVEGGAPSPVPVALADDAALDRYCYHVAGCVGEFWADLTRQHLPGLWAGDSTAMRELGIRFGKGLQMINILRDLPSDLRRGRSYLPRTLLDVAGIRPERLAGGGSAENPLPDALQPVLLSLLDITIAHCRAGWQYTLAIPPSLFRLRLACALPLLIGFETLALLRGGFDRLLRGERLKVPRQRIWQLLALVTLRGRWNGPLDRMRASIETRGGLDRPSRPSAISKPAAVR